MKKTFSKAALLSAACLPFFVIAAPAMAQSSTAPANCADENNNGTCDVDEQASGVTAGTQQNDGTIVVTGSRIPRDEYSATEGVTVVTAQEITQAGFNSATDALQSAEVT